MKQSDYTQEYQQARAQAILEENKNDKRSIEQAIEAIDWNIEYSDNYDCRKFTNEYMERMVKETAVPPKEKLTTATLAVEELEESDADRIINEYNRAAQGLGNAQRRLARASKELDDFNKS
jgi:hypothetical protein